MPEHVLYGVITFLGLAVITLTGLWVRAHDNHRQWAVERITEHDRKMGILENNHSVIKEDIKEIKDTLKTHLELEEKFQRLILNKLGVKQE